MIHKQDKSEWFAHPLDVQVVREKMQAIWGSAEPEPENPLPSPPPPKTNDAKPKPDGNDDKPLPKKGNDEKPPPKTKGDKHQLLKKHAPPKMIRKSDEELSVMHDVESVQRNGWYRMMVLLCSMVWILGLYILYEIARRKKGQIENMGRGRCDGVHYGKERRSLSDPVYGSIVVKR